MEKAKLHAQLVFIHQALTQKNQYFVDEFEIAKDAIKTITEMANKLSEELKAEQATEEVSVEAVNE